MRPDDPLKELIPDVRKQMQQNLEMQKSLHDHFDKFHKTHTRLLSGLSLLTGIFGLGVAAYAMLKPDGATLPDAILVAVMMGGAAAGSWVAYGPGTGDKTPKNPGWPPPTRSDGDGKTDGDDGDGEGEAPDQ